jgi:hypothetical protein
MFWGGHDRRNLTDYCSDRYVSILPDSLHTVESCLYISLVLTFFHWQNPQGIPVLIILLVSLRWL